MMEIDPIYCVGEVYKQQGYKAMSGTEADQDRDRGSKVCFES
jgi:hypothetical protein